MHIACTNCTVCVNSGYFEFILLYYHYKFSTYDKEKTFHSAVAIVNVAWMKELILLLEKYVAQTTVVFSTVSKGY